MSGFWRAITRAISMRRPTRVWVYAAQWRGPARGRILIFDLASVDAKIFEEKGKKLTTWPVTKRDDWMSGCRWQTRASLKPTAHNSNGPNACETKRELSQEQLLCRRANHTQRNNPLCVLIWRSVGSTSCAHHHREGEITDRSVWPPCFIRPGTGKDGSFFFRKARRDAGSGEGHSRASVGGASGNGSPRQAPFGCANPSSSYGACGDLHSSWHVSYLFLCH